MTQPRKRLSKLGKLALFGLALLGLAYWLGWLNTEMIRGQQIMSGSMLGNHGKGPNIGAIGHLGGVPVVVPPGFAHFVEYDGDPHFMERRKGPRPERTFQSGISSFGFWVRYPDMATATWENREERDSPKYYATTPWMRVGIDANSIYGYRGDDKIARFAKLSLESAQDFHQYERLPKKQYELTVYTPKDADLSRRVMDNPKGNDSSDVNFYLHESANGTTDAYITCPNRMRDADECEHRFTLAPTMEVLVAVDYRKGLLPHWRDIQARLTETLLSFRQTEASFSPSLSTHKEATP